MSELKDRIAAFEESARKAQDPKEMALKISEFSDRKKYNFAEGMQRDLISTRAALRNASTDGLSSCTFGAIYEQTEGRIANLNKILLNLKKAGEIDFKPEIFFEGRDDDEVIEFFPSFLNAEYQVDQGNVFRPGRNIKDVPEEERHGRSYVKENMESKGKTDCETCGKEVTELQRLVIRGNVFHLNCVHCIQCGGSPHEKADFVTFDGHICCSAKCVRLYDGSHQNQKRA
mmetsp:Transcript_4162/g.4825  ORF Transcript_4162/g.4825 Transcript_4162/m.4825 type:complete len:230 (+) Transcript_4162:93-782(+)|eukprot:CAMPEP_0184021160 /NCGR_PEP_ID=MMETSP0954-20121128/9761_1 /TAXON_ID=627963 /ORGANISM="Aplanochytrium sp, Strain PBS07" /LENGTH=229 /DNA_ID=CAMNT_0026303123 /DNA_START=108 /DNA_END=797 /DNA_ORIENTATION=+